MSIITKGPKSQKKFHKKICRTKDTITAILRASLMRSINRLASSSVQGNRGNSLPTTPSQMEFKNNNKVKQNTKIYNSQRPKTKSKEFKI